LRVAWLPGRFREQPLDHLFDLAVQSAMRDKMSAIGPKRTSPVALHMSAFDPKRT
jgi:hypothetical protein